MERGHYRWGTPPTGDPHRGEDPTEDPPPEGRATQGNHTEHKQTPSGLTRRFLWMANEKVKVKN